MSSFLKRTIVVAFMLPVLVGQLLAQTDSSDRPFLHPLFTDNMVLQRDVRFSIWGWTAAGSKVTVKFLGQTANATASADGKWKATLGPFLAGGPYTLEVSGPQSVALKNVMMGDVWLCSGQSNMEMGISNVKDAQQEIAEANYPNIRLFTVQKTIATEPMQTVKGHWDECNSKTIATGGWGGFSAVGYFFGRELHQDLKVPIGLIHSSWGGTPAEAWTSPEALSTMPEFVPIIDSFKRTLEETKKGSFNLNKEIDEWWQRNDSGSSARWFDPAASVSSWKKMNLPTYWEEAGLPDYDGLVWFSRSFNVPENWVGKDLMLHLGPIDDDDTTWVNGTKVGAIDGWDTPRNYRVPAGVLKPGLNTIRVRALDTGGPGGFHGKPEDMKIELASGGGDSISLAGEWLYQETTPMSKLKPFPKTIASDPNGATVLYNGMIAPLVPFAIKGAIWYQGEANAGHPIQYRTLLPTMIKDWRSRFGNEFPFLIVQLANFMAARPEPSESQWATLRESQLLTGKTVPRTAVATAIDIGDDKDIHPKNKQEVGHRLALAARAIAYGEKIEYAGPIFRKMTIEGSKVRLTFDHVGSGLVAKNGNKLQGFAIAGPDKRFVWGDAVIDGNTVVVSSDQIKNPAAVRYDWADNPDGNLYNKANLPAFPFRTDQNNK